MLQIATGTFRLFAARWPTLIAIYLAGWTARFLLIRLAGWATQFDPLIGMLILPIAVLARLASYVAMFLILRDSMPGFRAFESRRLSDVLEEPRKFAEVLGSSILGFFIIFATWDMLEDDRVDYANSALEQANWFDEDSGGLFSLGLTPITISIVVIAFALKFVIKRFQKKLPGWSNYLAVYLEAVWIFVAVVVLKALFADVPGWVLSRRVVAGFLDLVDSAREAFAPLGWALDAVGWLIAQAGIVIVLPLAWLALAGIVYSTALALPGGITAQRGEQRRLKKVTERYEKVPGFLRARIAELTGDLASRWNPIADSARLIWTAGALVMTFYVLAYAVLDTSTLWLNMGVLRLMGPHELGFWFATDNPLSLLVDVLVEPIRLCLIAATYDYALRVLDERDNPQESPSSGPAKVNYLQAEGEQAR